MSFERWPALAGISSRVWESEITVERAIWGKVPGQRSDFRWIARSPGFVGHLGRVEAALRIGREDRPVNRLGPGKPVLTCKNGANVTNGDKLRPGPRHAPEMISLR